MVSYFRFTAFTPAKCSREYNDVEAWPAERMNRHDSARSDLQGQIAETLATAFRDLIQSFEMLVPIAENQAYQ